MPAKDGSHLDPILNLRPEAVHVILENHSLENKRDIDKASECLYCFRMYDTDMEEVLSFFASIALAFKGRRGQQSRMDNRMKHGVGLLNELRVL